MCFLILFTGVAVFTNMTAPLWAEVERQSLGVLSGGKYKPKSCMPDSYVAIVVPYRNRETQLRIFLKHIHPFLRNQFLQYRIFIIELVRDCLIRTNVYSIPSFPRASVPNIVKSALAVIALHPCFLQDLRVCQLILTALSTYTNYDVNEGHFLFKL